MIMVEGMLWFDNSPERRLNEKLRRAIDYYEGKYGNLPTVCYVHPGMLMDAEAVDSRVAVKGSNTVLPNHFWIGIEGENKKKGRASAA